MYISVNHTYMYTHHHITFAFYIPYYDSLPCRVISLRLIIDLHDDGIGLINDLPIIFIHSLSRILE